MAGSYASDFVQDVRQGLRSPARTPQVSVVALVILALAIGASEWATGTPPGWCC